MTQASAKLHEAADQVKAVPVKLVEQVRTARDTFVQLTLPREKVDMKAALKALPPLIKGYLRLGAYICEDAVIDHQFGTTDVLVVLPMQNVTARYRDRFVADEQQLAA